MKCLRKCLALAVLLALAGAPSARGDDSLYVSDSGDNTIKSFNAGSGALQGTSAGPDASGLAGPRGIVIAGGTLLVANQNVNLDITGEVLRYDATTGAFLGALVPSTNPDAPFAPDGIVLSGGDLLVANVARKSNTGPPGRVNGYDAATGALLGVAKMKNNEHHPRGVVFGPDGLLYVSTRDLTNGQGGTVLRFDATGHSEVFIDDKGGFGRLNRPDGLVFGPDGRLYVTSFRAGPGDTDSVRIYNPDGGFAGKIDLHNGTTDTRVFAQALLFGPGGKLFVPVATSADPTTSAGSVRRYDVNAGTYDVFISFQSGALRAPGYLTFGRTNPATLSYGD